MLSNKGGSKNLVPPFYFGGIGNFIYICNLNQ